MTCSFTLSLACSSGGGGSSPVADPTVLYIIIPSNAEIVESDGIGLLDENDDGSGTNTKLGTISDNNNNGEAYYKLPENDL